MAKLIIAVAQLPESMKVKKDPVHEPVAAVCGNEMRVYGPTEFSSRYPKGIRPLWSTKTFNNHGQALQAAVEREGG